MDTENLLKLGLSHYEALCYLALLKYGNLSGKEIATKTKVPQTSVYRNMVSLEEKKFVQILQKEPFVYQAVKPEIAVPAYVKDKRSSLEQLKNSTINQLKKVKFEESKPAEEVLQMYSGREQSYKLGRILIQNANKEVLLIGRGTRSSILDLIHPLKSAARRGLSCKLIFTASENAELIKELKSSGIKIKYNFMKSFSLLIADRDKSQLVIKKDEAGKERTILLIKSKDLAQAHAQYFDSLWGKSTII